MYLLFYVVIGVCSLVALSLFVSWAVVSLFLSPVQVQPKGLFQKLIKAMQIVILRKLINFFQPLKRSKRKIQSLPKKSKKLTLYGSNLVLLALTLTNSTAFCQNDTIPKSRKDSIAVWLPYIVRDLKDYDLVKQKTYYQAEQIKGLQAISNAQKNISVRQSITLQSYSGSIVVLQKSINNLQAEAKKQRKKLIKSRLENWAWRVGAIAGLYFILR